MVLQPIQIPVLLIRVRCNNDQTKILFRITAFVAKLEDLPPCIFYVQIQGEIAPKIPSGSVHTQKNLLTLLLANAPLQPNKILSFRTPHIII